MESSFCQKNEIDIHFSYTEFLLVAKANHSCQGKRI